MCRVSPLRCSARCGPGTIAGVRAWVGELTGWLEPELELQLRLVREVPVVAARRLKIYGDIERVIADALEVELGPGRQLAARLAAASMMAALRLSDRRRPRCSAMEEQDGALADSEIATLLDDAVAFAEAGIAVASGG